MYHNTNYATPVEQQEGDIRTEAQSRRVLACLRTFGEAGATPEQICDKMGGESCIFIGSVRRSLSDMTKKTFETEKIPDKIKTKRGSVCSRWRAL